MPAIASFFVETEGAKLYDRRLDSTAGGSGSHRLKDPSTWEVSSNPAVALDHYLLGRYRDASSEPTFGVGLDPSLVNYSRFATMANLCDEDVAVTQTQWYTTTQPRYEANGIILSTDSYKDTILNLCRSMNARASDLGGELGVIDNEAKAAVIDLEDKDVAPEATEIYIEKKSRDDLIGGVRGNYQDPDNNYNPTDYPSYTDSAWETEDGSILEYDTLDLDFETDPERAQRLAKMHALRARRQASLQGAYNMKALILEDGDWFTRTTEKFPSGKTFEVIGSPVLDTSTMTVKINAIEVDTSDTAWNAATDPRPVVAPVASSSGLPPQLGSANISIQPTTYVSPGGMELPAIEVRNLAHDDEIPEALEVEVALDAGDGSPLDDAQTVYMPAGREYGTLAPLLPDTDYLLRTRRVLNERSSGWTVWSSFTTTANYTVESIAGQGPLATSSFDEDDIFDAATTTTPLNANPYFTDPRSPSTGVPQGWTDWVQGGTITKSTPRYNSAALAAYLDANNHIGGNYGLFQNNLPAQAGKKYKARLTMRRTGGNYYGCGLYVNPRSSAGASLTSAYKLDCATVPNTAGDVQAHHDGITTWEVIYTMPANTSYVIFYLMGRWTGFPSYDAAEAPFEGHVLECSLTEITDAERRTETQEDGANVTGDHTALAIVGQDWGATASEDEAANTRAAIGAQSLIDPSWYLWGDSKYWATDGTIPGASEQVLATNDRDRYLRVTATATAGGQYRRVRVPIPIGNGLGNQALPVVAGDRVAASVRIGVQNHIYSHLWVEFRNGAGVWVGGSYATAVSPGSGTGTRESFTLVEHIAEAPAGAVWACFAVRGYANAGQNLDLRILEPMISKVAPGQTVVPPFATAPGAYNGADVTGDNTALAFVGQGDLATANAASVRKVTTSISGNGDTFLVASGNAVGNVWHQAASITLNTDAGGSVEVGFNCHFDGIAGAAQNMDNAPYATVVARVKRGSTVIASGIRIARVVCDSSGEVDPWSGSSFTVVDNSPGGGSVTYSVELMVEDADPKSPTSTICELLTGRGEFMKCASYPSDANDFA
jgi:hypothetical protein